MATLRETLGRYTVDKLKEKLAIHEPPTHGTRKAELLEALVASLTGEPLRALWHSLSDLERQTITEAAWSPDLLHNEARVRAKYGEVPPFFIPDEDSKKYGTYFSNRHGTLTKLNLLLFVAAYSRDYHIPEEIAADVRELTTRPAPFSVSSSAEPPQANGLTIRHTQEDALAEVTTLLRLAEQGQISMTEKTGMPTKGSQDKLLDYLSGGDFFPKEVALPSGKNRWEQEIGLIKPIGWLRLLHATGYLSPGGTRSKLTPAGIKALVKPPQELIKHLWTKWLATTKYEEFNRVDEIGGQHKKRNFTAKAPRRKIITEALKKCPADQWVTLQDLSAFMLAEDHHFEVVHDESELYFGEHHYGHFGYQDYGGWDVVQLRYLLTLLMEYAATLGLIDIAFTHPQNALPGFRHQWGADDLEWLSRYDGLRSFRITPLGAYCLGLVPEFQRPKNTSSLQLSLSPDLTIKALSPDLTATDQLLLKTWAEPLTDTTWRLDALQARDAIERGQDPEHFLAFLRESDPQPLPETVQGFFQTATSNAHALKHQGEAQLFTCRDAATTTLIQNHKTLGKLCLRCSETQLAVPIAHLPKFQKQVRAMGLGFM